MVLPPKLISYRSAFYAVGQSAYKLHHAQSKWLRPPLQFIFIQTSLLNPKI
jgi:hypothetical protein